MLRAIAHRAVRNRYRRGAWAAASAGWLGLLAALTTGCERNGAKGEPVAGGAAGAPVPVVVAQVVREDMPVQVTAIGWAEAYQTVTVKPRVEGQVTEIHFTEGQFVKAGDLLFTIDRRSFESELRLAEANLARDKAMADDAEKDAQWKEDLFAQGTATTRERDQGRAKADAAHATVRADEAAVETAKLRLEYCTIRSPLVGRAGALLTDPGNIVKANDTALVTIEQIQPIYVAFSIPEQDLSAVKKHMAAGELAVEARIPQDEGPPERGVLSFLDSKVDNTTGTVRLKGTFPNEAKRLWPGLFVNVTLTLETEKNAVVVPAEAVQAGQNSEYVFVVKEDQSVDFRPVVVGRTVGQRTVISKGVSPGEVVVTDGQLRLSIGAKVEIREKAATSQGAGS